jgi:asparagine synthase (glutamine-hydrolysing)
VGAFVARAGWPATDAPDGAWTARLGDDLPIAFTTEAGPGAAVVGATSADGRYHVAMVGALANRRELDDMVGRSGGVAGARSDAALVLRLYEGRGEQSASALRGAFAIALWDGRRGRLVLARDQLGVQTLFYAAARGHCVASSRLAPLLRVPGLAGAPDIAMVDVVIALGTVPAPATVHPGIRQVCPGELLVWEPGRLRTQRYWQLRFPEARGARRPIAREGARRVREQVDEAVRIRTAGVVTGLLLSGGVGAASVLAVATALDRRPALAATVAGDADDVRHAGALARRASVEHLVLDSEIDWPDALDRSLAVHGAPIGALDEPMLATAAAALGGRAGALVAGFGAEDVLGGAAAERTWGAGERYRALPALARESLDILAGTGWPRRLARAVRAARMAPVDVFADVDVALGREARHALYGPELAHLVAGGPTERMLGALAGDAVSQGATDARDVLYAMRLAVGVARTAARIAAALETPAELAFPLVDPRLAQMSAALPARLRAAGRRRAAMLQHAVAAELPRDLLRRAHRPAEPPPAAWRAGRLAVVLEETLAPSRLAEIGLFAPSAVAALRAAHAKGRTELGAILWRLALVHRWLERPARAVADYSSAPASTSAVIASSS